MSNHTSSKDESFGSKVFIITILTLLVVGAIAFVIAIYYFGILGLFSILGVKYDTLWSLFLFTLFYFLLGIIGDGVVKVLLSLMKISGKWSKLHMKMGLFMFSFLVNWAIISFLDAFMNSIDLQFITKMILSLIFAIIDFAMETDEKKSV
ncbi:YrvL family regulatory protein [Siminovitchia sp. FSL H7-0308]|uniref:Membrane protein n=1 Tax=Siminovitchia thermophila TaxID=1245522 RepID=A0ABS2R2T3_9BACI|nr:YrvL family regulatory protein [Siminovitchia thermophila]MBM7713894.1 putative membrane protein [Siminovitchia thermophila]